MTARPPTRTSAGHIAAVGTLVTVVVGIVAVAFRGSWGALRDAALACHVDPTSASLYPFAVDGLLIVAILAAVLLRHDPHARRYCLGIIGSYTFASWLINFLHGLGQFQSDPVTGERPVPDWPVVVVVASLLIGSIFLGSHLLVYVWRALWPETVEVAEPDSAFQAVTPAVGDITPVPDLPADKYEVAKAAYRASLHPQLKTLSQTDLVERYGLTRREAGRVQREVKEDQHAAPTGPPADDLEEGQPVTAAASPGINGAARIGADQ